MIKLSVDPSYTEKDGKGLIKITVPAGEAGICYHILHSENGELHADNWRISSAWICPETTPVFCITERGEWETAIFLKRSACFTGGILHGCENSGNIRIYTDGQEVSAHDTSDFTASEIRICTESKLLEPAEEYAPFAVHRKEYCFNGNELVIRQNIEWIRSAEAGRCYMAMFPVSKKYSDYLMVKGEKNPVDLRESCEFSVSGVSSVCTFTEDRCFQALFSISDCPEEWMTKGTFLVTDNDGRDYHKMYYMLPVHGIVEAGEEWHCESHYSFQWESKTE